MNNNKTNNTRTIILEGIDGVGKTTVAKHIKTIDPTITVLDRSDLTKLTLENPHKLPSKLEHPTSSYYYLECSLDTAENRIKQRGLPTDKWEQYSFQFYFQKIFRMLAAKYGVNFISTETNTPEDVAHMIVQDKCLRFPNMDNMNDKTFNSYKFIAEGHSKIVRRVYDKWDVIKLKPSVHSHKEQRSLNIDDTDKYRAEAMLPLLYLFAQNQIDHLYNYVSSCEDGVFILTQAFDYVPPVEVIIKSHYVGTDKHIYHELYNEKTRFDKPLMANEDVYQIQNTDNTVVSKVIYEYNKPYVRFDYRNPNHVECTEDVTRCASCVTSFKKGTQMPLGDKVMASGLADNFIDTAKCEKSALKLYDIMNKFLGRKGLYLLDICYLYCADGETLYGEISQDTGRWKDKNGNSKDKDVFRYGRSADKVNVKDQYKELADILNDIMFGDGKSYRIDL